jgi:hypothetical protein
MSNWKKHKAVGSFCLIGWAISPQSLEIGLQEILENGGSLPKKESPSRRRRCSGVGVDSEKLSGDEFAALAVARQENVSRDERLDHAVIADFLFTRFILHWGEF